MSKIKKRNPILFIVCILALIALAIGWYLSQKSSSYFKSTADVTVKAQIISMDDPSKSPDSPQKMQVKLESGELLTTYSYCGYTRIEEAPKIESDLKVGDKVQIHGQGIADTSEIDVCSSEYYITKV